MRPPDVRIGRAAYASAAKLLYIVWCCVWTPVVPRVEAGFRCEKLFEKPPVAFIWAFALLYAIY